MEHNKDIKTEIVQEPTNLGNNIGKDTQAQPTKYVDVRDFEILKKDYELLKYDFLKLQKETQDSQQANSSSSTDNNSNKGESLDDWNI